MDEGPVIWVTGLSGAGKTTLASEIFSEIRSRDIFITMLDGDDLRRVLKKDSEVKENVKKNARLDLAYTYARLCHLLASQGGWVVISTVSLFREIHEWNRENFSNYYEIYLKTPIDELKKRDSRGLYNDYDQGQMENLVGLDLKLDEPKTADWIEEFNIDRKPHDVVASLISEFGKKGWLSP